MIEAWFDGACEPRNPGGHATYGIVIKVDGKVLFRDSVHVGSGPTMTNNVAEYAGVIALLEKLKTMDGPVVIYGDSKLVIEQLSGRWGVKGGLYVPFYRRAKELALELGPRVSFRWISGTDNFECDRLSRDALKPLMRAAAY